MDPRARPMAHEYHTPPLSRTTQYKKVTKPLLERKRRARINRCLEELKDLMVGALEAEGENVSKLEKADILELTVRHLHSLGRPRDAVEDAHRFQAGFSQCASEACQFLLSLPGLDAHVGRRLVSHLGQCVSGPLSVQVAPPSRTSYSPPVSPATPTSTSKPCASPASTCSSSTDLHVVTTFTPSVHDLSRPHTGLLMTVALSPASGEVENDVRHGFMSRGQAGCSRVGDAPSPVGAPRCDAGNNARERVDVRVRYSETLRQEVRARCDDTVRQEVRARCDDRVRYDDTVRQDERVRYDARVRYDDTVRHDVRVRYDDRQPRYDQRYACFADDRDDDEPEDLSMWRPW